MYTFVLKQSNFIAPIAKAHNDDTSVLNELTLLCYTTTCVVLARDYLLGHPNLHRSIEVVF